MGGVVTASPAVTSGDVLYIGIDNGRLFSINGWNGSINWNYLTDGPIRSSVSINDSGTVYFGSNDGKLYAMNSDGTVKWSFLTGDAVQSSPSLDTLGNVYVGSNDGKLYKVDDSGAEIWQVATGGAVRSSPVLGSDGTVYFGSADNMVYAVSANGQVSWTYQADSPVNGTGALGWNGILYIGTDSGKLLAISPEGELLWYYQTGYSITAPPMVTGDNMIYVGSGDGALYGLVDPNLLLLAKQSALYLPNQWPTFQHNNQRTGQRAGDAVGPGLSVALLPNPIIPSHVDLYLFSDQALRELPVVELNGTAQNINTAGQIADNVYHAALHLAADGSNALYASAVDLNNNAGELNTDFSFAKVLAGRDNRLALAALGVEVRIPAQHVAASGAVVLMPVDVGNPGSWERLQAEADILPLPGKGRMFAMKTTAPVEQGFVLISRVESGAGRSIHQLTSSGWVPLRTYTDESGSQIWAYPQSEGLFGIFDGGAAEVVPRELQLAGAYPNPFNASAVIRYTIPAGEYFTEHSMLPVKLTVYNLRGQAVKTLLRGDLLPGSYETVWDATGSSGQVVASGIYLLRLSAGEQVAMSKITVLK
jgi:outer membrane protein assembly factor BamB